jgi:hypothetical protein
LNFIIRELGRFWRILSKGTPLGSSLHFRKIAWSVENGLDANGTESKKACSVLDTVEWWSALSWWLWGRTYGKRIGTLGS